MADLGGQQFVVHGDLAHLGLQSGDFILAIVALAFLQGERRAASRAQSHHSVSLATETFASRATTSSGSPRNKHATANLRWAETRCRSAIDARGGTRAGYGGALQPPSGFNPVSIVIFRNLRLRDANYRSQMSQLTVTHPSGRRHRHP